MVRYPEVGSDVVFRQTDEICTVVRHWKPGRVQLDNGMIVYRVEIRELTENEKKLNWFRVGYHTVSERLSQSLGLAEEEEAVLIDNLAAITDEVIERLCEEYWFDTVCEVAESVLEDHGLRESES